MDGTFGGRSKGPCRIASGHVRLPRYCTHWRWVVEIGARNRASHSLRFNPGNLRNVEPIRFRWCSQLFPAEAFDALATPLAKLDEALPGFYERNVISSDYAVAAWQDATEAARRGVSNVSPRRISIMRRLLALHPCVGDDKCSRR